MLHGAVGGLYTYHTYTKGLAQPFTPHVKPLVWSLKEALIRDLQYCGRVKIPQASSSSCWHGCLICTSMRMRTEGMFSPTVSQLPAHSRPSSNTC